jgi:hypothetical protein
MRSTPGNRAHRLREIVRDRARRLAKRARQLEGDRDGEVAERARRRHLDRERRHLGDAEVLADRGRNRVVNVALNAQNHERLTGPPGRPPLRMAWRRPKVCR